MMSRKIWSRLAAVAIVYAAATANAQSVVVIGDFDGLPNNTDSPQGWHTDFDNGAGTAIEFHFPTAVTTGDGALSLVTGTDFKWSLTLDNGARPTLGADILSHPLLMADVTWVTSQWTDSTPADTTDNWAKWEKLAVNDNTGWEESPVSNDPVNPGFPGSWDSVNFGASHTRTLSWDLSNQHIDTSGFVQIHMAVNMSNKSFPNGGRFWVDNIRLVGPVPEPGTLCLMGGALLLPVLRRRARK